MIVLDTTVLVYATGSEHPYREPCRSLVEAVASGRVAATTTVEVVQEFVHVRSRRRSHDDAAQVGAAYASLLAPLLQVDGDDLLRGLQLFRSTAGIGAFEAVLAAVASSRHATALVSADAAFGAVPGLPAVLPDEPSIAQLLASS